MLLRRKATIAAAAASAAAATGAGGMLSPTWSPNSAARAIPTTARPKNAGPAAPPYHQSALVRVPVRPPRKPDMGRLGEFNDDDDFQREAGGAGPAAPFSMLEGAGHTLKGLDLRRVRDAVLRQIGFLD